MSFTYAVVGAGRQGTAAAYDMARFGDAARVKVADADEAAARRAAGRVNDLLGREIAEPFVVDVANRAALRAFLDDVDSFLSAVPYWHNPAIARVAIDARASMTDLGGNTDLVREQLLLSPEAEAAGIAMIPDCGQVPGMGTSLTVHAMSLLDETDEVTFWDGGNPLHPRPPFNYILTFNIAGLTNEYHGVAHFLRDGRRVEVPTFREEDYETVDFPAPIGRMEAFVAGAARPRCPGRSRADCAPCGTRPFAGRATSPPGRRTWTRGSSRPSRSTSAGCRSCRGTSSTRFSTRRSGPGPASPTSSSCGSSPAAGRTAGRPRSLVELIDRYDEATGFTAMERTTGWDGSLKAILNARGVTPRGAHPAEVAVPGPLYAEELRRRGFSLTEEVTTTAG